MSKSYFITGIGTEIGKTMVSAFLVEKLNADYWKPIQSGDLDNSDTMKVKNLISNIQTVFHSETYRLTQPFSPHHSANLDGVKIDLDNFIIPETENNLIIEGAGGLMVPINEEELIIDLIKKLDVDVILVSKNYLGSINHTLLSIEALRNRNIKIKGIIFNGDENQSTQNIIVKLTGIKVIANIPQLEKLDKTSLKELVDEVNLNL
ncbi:ATP-dependent dethiobiotin synthetase BioD [Pedobacter psychrophilus]|uniref:ATP-dependent dethiobiotin synthetase BioD n=1 Tax=Pedobacter psychrophilus TaxID=1826909 RepID=A0A179DB82_9SPHI|nr:dethiobiotin synthase [Pedobacter psychrophilus]OAQ38174.1 ATP-dependent dethiobiotin synthetase BioD [Pedobacter psychrophilus]